MNGTLFPPTPLSSTSQRQTPLRSTPQVSTSVSFRPTPIPTFSTISTLTTRGTPPPTFSPPTFGFSTVPGGVVATSAVAKGIFGAGANFDPLIIFALIVAGLVFFFVIGGLIYCCWYYCCRLTTRPQQTIIRRTPSLHSIRPIHTITPKRYSCPANNTGCGNYVSYSNMCSANNTGCGNYVSYSNMRPTVITGTHPVITTLGDGYAMGHSLRSVGNRYGGRSVMYYEDDPSPKIVTLY